ncbi:MAG: hypothetical protein Q8N63_05520 [Nanoarchaeota archaeon]|nr:hypothetical protein [Nanoarchaeota archaeon]
MRENLKKILKELVEDSIRDFNGKTFPPKRISFTPERIIIFSSHKLKSDASTTIFNYLQNCFYNTQWHIDNPVPVEIIPYYNIERDKQEGDYFVDVGGSLIKYSIDSNDFLKS